MRFLAFALLLAFLTSTLAQTELDAKKSAFFFFEDFEKDVFEAQKWVLSRGKQYKDQLVSLSHNEHLLVDGFGEDAALFLENENQHFAVATSLNPPLQVNGLDVVLQFELSLGTPISCGGAYLKFLRPGDSDSDSEDVGAFDSSHPYIIMFGPDKCGGTNKIHVIIQHLNPVSGEWEEKHMDQNLPMANDLLPHLYTLVIRKDDSFQVQLDQATIFAGSLHRDMLPPFSSPEMIDDPTDSKPEDWVDEEEIPDPNASKPDDWDEDAPAVIPDTKAVKPAGWLDDEEEFIPDPEMEMPEEWDEEEDGEWEAPLVPNPLCEEASGCGQWEVPMTANPAYKGKWSAPLIPNPAYKGEWAPRQIPNPAFYEEKNPASLSAPISGIGIEVWSSSGQIYFDNIVIDTDEKRVREFGEQTWHKRFQALEKAKKQEEKKAILEERQRMKDEGGLNNLTEAYLGDLFDYFGEHPNVAGMTILAVFGAMLYSMFGSSSRPHRRGTREGENKKQEEKKDEGEETGEEGEDEQQEQDDDPNDKRMKELKEERKKLEQQLEKEQQQLDRMKRGLDEDEDPLTTASASKTPSSRKGRKKRG